MSDQYWKQPLKWNRDGLARVFCGSMCDLFEAHPVPAVRAMQDAARARLWELIEATPNLTWQLLTKRPENIAGMVPWGDSWPNTVWIGTSVEDQRRADERIPYLLSVPAPLHFLSCEPLLGPVDLNGPVAEDQHRPRLTYWLTGRPRWGTPETTPTGLQITSLDIGPKVGWVIAGGESGSGARPMDPVWARSLRDQCLNAGVPFHFKQWGGRTSKAGGRELDGRSWDEFPQGVPV